MATRYQRSGVAAVADRLDNIAQRLLNEVGKGSRAWRLSIPACPDDDDLTLVEAATMLRDLAPPEGTP